MQKLFLVKQMKKSQQGGLHESSFRVLAALKNAWTRLYVIIYFHFLAALHGHSCILCTPWRSSRAGTREQTLSVYVGPPTEAKHWVNFHWCHTGSVFTPWVKTKAPDQPMKSCFLWSVLMLIVDIYFDIFGKKRDIKSLDIFGVEKQCVYQIIVTLSCSLKISLIFLEELYNIPTDLMFHWKNIYKF